jgi:kumamolisin
MQNQGRRFLSKVIAVATVAVWIVSFSTFAPAQQQRASGHGTTGESQAVAGARTPQAGYIYTPESSVERPEDAGLRFHTNYVLRSLDGTKPVGLSQPQDLVTSSSFSPDTVQSAETPASMGCLYVSSPTKRTTGCVPNSGSGTKGPSSAGWGAIALVDAYDNPDAASDLVTFDKWWGLPAAKFVKIYANGNGDCGTPAPNAGWSVESSLDIEWAHVFAPKAVIVLVEACSTSGTDLFYAEGVAIDYIQTHYGGGEVSNSWGGGEFSGESSYDYIFAGTNYNDYYNPVVTLASAGDSGCGAAYPSSNPWLTSAGGTSVLRNASTYTFNSEACWGGSGGGISAQETWSAGMGPAVDYQYPIFGEGARATPDLASNADPASGVWFYSLYGIGGWGTVGGTSVASPSLAGMLNRANNRMSTWFGFNIVGYGYNTNGENTLLYAQLPAATEYYKNFYDVVSGSNGCSVTNSWDYCTGVGSPRDLIGK